MLKKAALFMWCYQSTPKHKGDRTLEEARARKYAAAAGLEITLSWVLKYSLIDGDPQHRTLGQFIECVKEDPSIEAVLFQSPSLVVRRAPDWPQLLSLFERSVLDVHFFHEEPRETKPISKTRLLNLVEEGALEIPTV